MKKKRKVYLVTVSNPETQVVGIYSSLKKARRGRRQLYISQFRDSSVNDYELNKTFNID